MNWKLVIWKSKQAEHFEIFLQRMIEYTLVFQNDEIFVHLNE